MCSPVKWSQVTFPFLSVKTSVLFSHGRDPTTLSLCPKGRVAELKSTTGGCGEGLSGVEGERLFIYLFSGFVVRWWVGRLM